MIGADNFNQPLGTRLARGAVDGYPLDLRAKAPSPDGRAVTDHGLRVPRIQEGLGAFERHLAGEPGGWLELASQVGSELLRSQRDDGGWAHTAPCPHTFRVDAPWLSAMAQGQGASLLVRLARADGDVGGPYAEAARKALDPLAVAVADGGVASELDGLRVLQEYPTIPASHVLNGAIFALWGVHDVGTGLGDPDARASFDAGVDALASSLPAWDLGWWSRYDLYPHPCLNVASPAYHRLHSDQLEALALMTGREEFDTAARRFRGYAESRLNRARAIGAKLRFRSRVPRGRRFERARRHVARTRQAT